jgi:hypothetical protein
VATSRLVSRFFRGRLVLITMALFVITLICYVWLLLGAPDSVQARYKTQIESVVLGLFASTCVTAAYEYFKLSADDPELADQMFGFAIKRLSLPFLPTESFEPTDMVRNDAFNTAISAQIKKSTKYWFRGVTGQHIGVRLLLASPAPMQLTSIEIAIADPTKLSSRSPYIVRNANRTSKDVSLVLSEVRDQIAFAIVALNEAAKRLGKTVVVHTSDSGFTERVEHFDQLTIVSMHSSDASETRLFPESYSFGPATIWHKFFNHDLQNVFQIGNLFKLDGTNEQLVLTLRSLGIESDSASIQSRRETLETRMYELRKRGLGV